MTKRIIEKLSNGAVMVKVYHDSEWSEYTCVIFINNVKQSDATTYYTDDKEDAIHTAGDMLKRACANI